MEAATKELISSTGYEEGWIKLETTTIDQVGNGRPCHENYLKPPSSPLQIKDSSSCSKQDVQLQSTRVEMGEAREENQRLKKYLDRIMKDYQNLQTKFFDIVKKDGRKTTNNTNYNHQEIEESEFVSLSLGRVPHDTKEDKKTVVSSKLKEDDQVKETLILGLDRRFELSGQSKVTSAYNSFEESKKEARETSWLPSKVLKTMRSGDDEIQQQNPVKKARVSVRARCETTTMNDGCRWRKYGQKVSKGNPCPRAYYRCTISPSCPERKQVQRCAEDISILITTYEGTHNHPLPCMLATTMASTTSAAASMLLSESSSSQLPGHSSSVTTANLHGPDFYKLDSLKSEHFYLSNSSFSSSVVPNSHPTITLDLTSSPSSSLPRFNKVSSHEYRPRYSSASLNFNSSYSDSMSWVNGFLNYGRQPYNKNQIGNLSMGRQPVEDIYQSCMQKKELTPQHSLQETIDTATKAITVDQRFQSALAAALTSIIDARDIAAGGAQRY